MFVAGGIAPAVQCRADAGTDSKVDRDYRQATVTISNVIVCGRVYAVYVVDSDV